MGGIKFLDVTHKSLDAMLKARGFKEIITIPDSEPIDRLSSMLSDSMREPYMDIRLLNTDLAKKGENYTFREKSHTLYVKK